MRGMISCGPISDCRLPMLVIDRLKVSWRRFGERPMTYEGWQFEVEIKDWSKEV